MAQKTRPKTAPAPDPVEANEHESREPDSDELGAAIVLVKTGYIRVTVAGERFRLRPPLFGEFRELMHALDDTQEEIEAASEEAEILGAEIRDALAALAADEQISDADRIRKRRVHRAEDIRAGRALQQKQESTTLAWWVLVWITLCESTPLPEFVGDTRLAPAWFTGGLLPSTVAAHWRAAPLVRG